MRAEIVSFFIFSIFSHRRGAGQVEDISSPRPWRSDILLLERTSFPLLQIEMPSSTHISQGVRQSSAQTQSIFGCQHHHDNVATNVALHLIGHPNSTDQPTIEKRRISVQCEATTRMWSWESSEPPYAGQSLASSCLGNSAANPARRQCPGSHDVHPWGQSECRHSNLFPVEKPKATAPDSHLQRRIQSGPSTCSAIPGSSVGAPVMVVLETKHNGHRRLSSPTPKMPPTRRQLTAWTRPIPRPLSQGRRLLRALPALPATGPLRPRNTSSTMLKIVHPGDSFYVRGPISNLDYSTG